MYCQRCQIRPATRQWLDDLGQGHPLCEVCAAQVQVFGSLQKMLLPALMQHGLPVPQCCPVCHFTWQDLNQLSHLGCAECYRHFRAAIESSLMRLHGQTVHGGRRPTNPSTSTESPTPSPSDLRQQLEQAVAEERYEDAVLLRDQLRRMQEPS